MALVTIDGGAGATAGALRGLVAAFRSAGLPVVHAVDTALAAGEASASASELDLELLDAGGVQTLGPAEMAVALATGGGLRRHAARRHPARPECAHGRRRRSH